MKKMLLLLFLLPLSLLGQNYQYVLAPSGLNMRQSSDPSSAKMQTVPYGAKVQILAQAGTKSMNIDNISGGMAKVKYDGQTGYMFDGYLARYPAPKGFMGTEKYVDKLREAELSYTFEECRIDNYGHISLDQTFYLDKDDWRGAYLVAWRLYELPSELKFPGEKGAPGEQVTPNPNPNEYAWEDQMVVRRGKDGSLESIEYYNRGEGGGSSITIVQSEAGTKIMRGSVAD